MEPKTFEAVVATNYEINASAELQKHIVLPAKVGDWLYFVSVDGKAPGSEFLLYRTLADLKNDAELLTWAEDD
jgi:hypothetical protein